MAQTSNDNTVIGVFDDYSTAERVARDLTNAGIPRESIEVKSNFMTGAAGRSMSEESHEGGISGFFHRLFGGHDEEHGHYAEAVRRGNAVVAVTAPREQLDQAVRIMNSAGAIDIDRHVAAYRETGYERHDPSAPPYSYEEATKERERFRGKNQEGGSIPVVEEEIRVGKRAVQRGGVRVYSHTVETPVEQDIQLREEHVRVERRPTDRAVESGDRMHDQSIEVTEMAEEPVVQKRARVREEVVVGKETTQRTEHISDTVRKTEVEVEHLGEGDRKSGTAYTSGDDYSSDFRRDYESRYKSSGLAYDAVEPAYNYGYRSANDARYRGRNWSDVENDLRTDYERNNPNSSWEKIKDAVRYGWEKVTGRR